MVDALSEASDRFCGEEWGVSGNQDIADSHRLVLHILQSGLFAHAEFDPERPVWRRIVSPTRKFTGDNADAVYFEAPVSGDKAYKVTGNLAGAVYTSFTVELGSADGKYATGTGGVLNDDDIDVDADGNYEVFLGGEPRDRNWLALPPDTGRITTRHYFEVPKPAAADESLHIPLTIECLSPVGPATLWTDETVAAAVNRVTNHVLGKTVQQPVPGTYPLPTWVSYEGNILPDPQPPGTMGFAAFDAYYTMGRYELGPDEALVMTGRWPGVQVRQCVPLDHLRPDLRLRQPRHQPQSGQHHPRGRRHVQDGHRPHRPRRGQLAGHRGPSHRQHLLAVLPAHRPGGADRAGAGQALRSALSAVRASTSNP